MHLVGFYYKNLPFILSETFETKRNYVKREEREEWCEAEEVSFFLYLVDKAPSYKDVWGSVGKTPVFLTSALDGGVVNRLFVCQESYSYSSA